MRSFLQPAAIWLTLMLSNPKALLRQRIEHGRPECWSGIERLRRIPLEMNSKSRFLSSCFLAAALSFSVLSAACEHHYYRVYDPYYSDYHVWNHDEVVYYQQWSHENHRDEHRDFRKLRPEEQKEYWTWRHSHGDNDHH
jgi:hypothetical protein